MKNYYVFSTGIQNDGQDIGIIRDESYTAIGMGILNKGSYTIVARTSKSIQKTELTVK